jgi:hypothetical protein
MAGSLSIPFAGAAWADPPTNHGNNGNGSSADDNGVGRGGVPGRLGELNGTPGTPLPPGVVVRDLRQIAQGQGYNNLSEYLRDQTNFRSPGDIISDVARGDLTAEQLQDLLDPED